MRNFILAGFLFLGLSAASAWDPNKPFIYEMRIAFETDNWINMYSTATVLSKSDNPVAFRVVANSTTNPTYQLVVTTQGNVGVGTSAPAQKFEVAGTISSTSGGFKFPDGSTQTAAGIASPASPQAGDLLYYDGTNWTKLPVGFYGQSLVVGDAYTKLLLHMDGTNGSTMFTDSASGHSVTVTGDAHINTAQSEFGGASGLFDGNGDWISAGTSSDFDFGSGDFTIDLWVYPTEAIGAAEYFIAYGLTSSIGAWTVGRLDNGNLYTVLAHPNCWDTSLDTGLSLPSNTWSHVAIVRSGTTIYPFVNGVLGTTASNVDSLLANDGRQLRVGSYGGESFQGNIDEVRISKGIARWTSNFTPPTAPYAASLSWSN